jgi:hypothetical protein
MTYPITETVSQNVREIMRERDLRFWEVCDMTGLSAEIMRKILAGGGFITPLSQARLLNGLSTPERPMTWAYLVRDHKADGDGDGHDPQRWAEFREWAAAHEMACYVVPETGETEAIERINNAPIRPAILAAYRRPNLWERFSVWFLRLMGADV